MDGRLVSPGVVYASPVPVVTGGTGYQYANNGMYVVTPGTTPVTSDVDMQMPRYSGIRRPQDYSYASRPAKRLDQRFSMGIVPDPVFTSSTINRGRGWAPEGGFYIPPTPVDEWAGRSVPGTPNVPETMGQSFLPRKPMVQFQGFEHFPKPPALERVVPSLPPIQESGDGDININIVSPEIASAERALERAADALQGLAGSGEGGRKRVVAETVEEALDRETEARVRNHAAKWDKDGVIEYLWEDPDAAVTESGLGAGNVADAFEPRIETSEEADAMADQSKILDKEERSELEKFNHPLKDPWVQDLPAYDRDLKPSEMCVMDCRERTRIHDLECDEVRRRVCQRLKELGCPTEWKAIPQKNSCS